MTMTDIAPSAVPFPEVSPGVFDVGGKLMMVDSKNGYAPVSTVKPIDKLTDETVRKMVDHARDLSGQIARFKGHCFDDVGSLQALIAQEYKATLGGPKGNISLTTFDGRLKVTVQVADQLTFGPELQAAKRLVDACLAEWTTGSRDELVAIVNRAFSVDKEGQINRAEIFMLLRVAIEDERWQSAMRAVRDSIRIIGSKTYIRFHERESVDSAWRPITIDLAAA
ncbi:DUF3164 family protein [Kaistia algarum]|uniref:DUF3164 family protein n=1 Tax=Kaistia algarum TaxID=2083279 RepID=UPI00269A4BEA|nr:DUF3164 family protein [Kaistia algarum]